MGREDQDAAVPAQFGVWKRGVSLGTGGAGSVWAAEHVETGAAGALKIAHAHLGALQRHWFRREAGLAARLRHPSIVSLIDSGEQEGIPYLVQERVFGDTLATLSSAGELDVEGVIAIGDRLFEALIYAHDAISPPQM